MAVAVSHQHQHPHPHLLAAPRRRRPREVPVCTFWLQGRCTRTPCKFAHTLPAASSPPAPAAAEEVPAITQQQQQPGPRVWRRPTPAAAAAAAAEEVAATAQQQPGPRIRRRPPPPEEVAATAQQQQQYSVSDTKQKQQHHDFTSTTKDAMFVAHLTGHTHCVTGVAFPHGSTKLYTAGQDATVRAWDCTTGQCTEVLPVSGTVACLFNSDCDPDWLFLGLPDEVRAWNLRTNTHQSLQATTHGGQVLSVTSCGDLLLAGLEKGSIFIWRFDPATASFLPAASLFGHTASVVALEPSSIGSKLFYSGSTDGTIRLWDLGTCQCLQVLQGHTGPVTKLLSSEQYLLSTSLDGSIKVWGLNTSSSTHTPVLQLQYTYPLEAAKQGCSSVPALCGVIDQDSKPILFCASSDSTVRILELPSFTERGVLFTPHPIRALDTGSAGLLFLGGSDGGITVWRWQPAR